MRTEVAAEGYWQVEYDLSKGKSAEPVWGVIELHATPEKAHERARYRASMGQRTRVVHKTDGQLEAESSSETP